MITGQPIDRRDGRQKVTGAAQYAAEFPVPSVVHAVLVQSTIAAGTIAGFELGAAQGMPGVLAIITPDNALKLGKGGTQQTVAAPLLQNGDVVYNGQHVAVVVADTLERAQAAAAAVRLRYTEGEAQTTMANGLAAAYVPKNFRNGQRPPDSARGDAKAAFDAALVRFEATYTTPVEHHNPMEPHATIAAWDAGRLTVWTSTQGVGGAQGTLAGLFGIDRADVRIISPFVGGGFGSKGSTWPPATLAAMAAKIVNRPVKLVLSRQQMYTSNGYRPATVQRLAFGVAADGTLQSIRHDGISQTSQPVLGEFVEPVALATEMLYACPNVAVTHRAVAVNQGLPTYMRAPGEASGVFALESALDEIAAELKVDPVALRLKNYAEQDPSEGLPFSSKRLRECYEQGAAAFEWDRRTPEPRSMRDGRYLVGMGMATATYPVNQSAASVRVRLLANGDAVLQSGTQDIGTGTYTVMAQLAADELGLPIERVRFELGDSRFPPAPVSGGSQTATSVGSAVLAACKLARDHAIAMAMADGGWQGDPASYRLQDGAVTGPQGRVTVGEMLARRGVENVEIVGDAKPPPKEHGKKTHSLHSFGAQFAEVRVDPLLGEIRVSRLTGVFDGGRVLNAKTARSQLIGGMVWGVGMALLEETLVDEATGRIVNANISEYLLPVNADIPAITALLLDGGNDQNANPVGIKSLGELPMVGVAAAIANAVHHATGVRVRDLPIRLEDVLA